ncbi:uncharacterized protein LOC134842558 [Symsagittifera roscoffensis]|uniref:uncharacterized protein LOC134842558 n=1 Tax=Symsagittifera roscoffensis TaxID=84072 RepID=UPI00307B7801
MTKKFTVLLLCVFFHTSFCRNRLNCPAFYGVKNVNMTSLVGKWYEIEKVKTPFEGLFFACTKLELSLPNDFHATGQKTLIANKTGTDGHQYESLIGTLRQSHQSKGEMHLRLTRRLRKTYNVKLVMFDENQYAVFYGCAKLQGPDNEYLFIYSREKTLPFEVLRQLNKNLRYMGVKMSSLIMVDQYNCTIQK